MNPETGEVRSFASIEEARAAGFTVDLEEIERLGLTVSTQCRPLKIDDLQAELPTLTDLGAEHTGLMRFFAGASRLVKGARRGFARNLFTEAKGSCWKPGAEHLPTGGPSRQVRRRGEHLHARALAREKQHNEGLPPLYQKPAKQKPGHVEREYIGTFVTDARFPANVMVPVTMAMQDGGVVRGERRMSATVRATTKAQARRKLREVIPKLIVVNVEMVPPAPLQGAGIQGASTGGAEPPPATGRHPAGVEAAMHLP